MMFPTILLALYEASSIGQRRKTAEVVDPIDAARQERRVHFVMSSFLVSWRRAEADDSAAGWGVAPVDDDEERKDSY